MKEKKPKIPLTGQVKLPKALAREINMEASRLDVFKYEVIAAAWDAYQKSITNSGKPPLAHPGVPVGSNQVPPANDPTNVDETPDSPMLQIVHQRHEWEHRAVDAILETDYAEAFRVNIRAVHLLAIGQEPDAGATTPAPRPKPLPGDEMEEIRKRLGEYEQALADAEQNIRRPEDHRGRGRKSKTGTD